MWNLERWYRWSYLQSRNGDTEVENKYGYQGGKRDWDKLGGWDWHIYTIDTVNKIGANDNILYSTGNST